MLIATCALPVREQENVTWLCVDNQTVTSLRIYAGGFPVGSAPPGPSRLRIQSPEPVTTLVIRELAVGYHETPYTVDWRSSPLWQLTWDYSYERSILSLRPAERCL